MTDRRICPVPGCGSSVRTGHNMCRECWKRVPAVIGRRVWATWKRFRQLGADGAPAAERLAALRAYREASDAAVAASEKAR